MLYLISLCIVNAPIVSDTWQVLFKQSELLNLLIYEAQLLS